MIAAGTMGWTMSISERLIKWHSLWQINRGIVICRSCRAQQREAEKTSSFNHLQGCQCPEPYTLPWSDLDRIAAGPIAPARA
ncbi:hypothetical protein IFR09_04635 [Pseudomonas syringae]|nr:hypothetical protein [Pseudomonas syringae]MBD8791681.1 hypothetical protein [Pseudomonas syringae]MBD8801041.1 hypothetical protein [Pseudomonas syringae]MBD8810445.1 hypothetical protein [Pseudomonas syringae]